MWKEKFIRFTTAIVTAWRNAGVQGAVNVIRARYLCALPVLWARFWMRYAGLTPLGRFATWIATRAPLPYLNYYYRSAIAELSPRGYVAVSARVNHSSAQFGRHVFIDDRVRILQDHDGQSIRIGDRVHICADTALHTGDGGSIIIGERTWIGPRCQLMGYKAAITIGARVLIAPNCMFYPYNHGIAPAQVIAEQELWSRGGIVIGDGAWVAANVTILSGVHIGKGAIIGAGAVVTSAVPEGAIAVGVPARVLKTRSSASEEHKTAGRATRAVFIRDADGTIRFWNSGGQLMYGWTPAETIGQTSHDLLRTRFPEPLEAIESALRKQGFWEGTLVHTRRDGTPIVVASRWEILAADTPSSTILEINSDLQDTEQTESPV
jgi:PAS domain S-box-containing protein